MTDKMILPVVGDPYRCLRCDAKLDAASYVGDRPDTPPDALDWLAGSISVCAYCQHVAIFVIDRGNIRLRPVRRGDERIEVFAALDEALPELADDLRKANP